MRKSSFHGVRNLYTLLNRTIQTIVDLFFYPFLNLGTLNA